MMIEFSIVPIGKGTSLSPVIARVMRIIIDSGIPYRANPMGTVMEGDWSRLMSIVQQCHEEAMKDADRVVTTIKIDDYKGKHERLEAKLGSVEKILGRPLNR
jgi:uncharacterized protein (TIGR00106 family)